MIEEKEEKLKNRRIEATNKDKKGVHSKPSGSVVGEGEEV